MIWQTRTLATFVAATVETDGENQLLEEAQKIGQKPGAEETTGPEPREGSYENFLTTFGNPRRWAGGMS